MFASSWFRPSSKRQRPTTRLAVEQLEDRSVPSAGSGGYLLVNSYDNDQVVRYDDTSGAFVDQFVSHRSGGLDQPYGMVFGPHDHDLYVTTGLFGGPDDYKGVLRYDGTTGAFLGAFTESGHLDSPRGIIFGPDGSLYVADRVAADDSLGRIVRFHGTTGAFLDEFVPAGFVGRPSGLVFAPSVEDAGRLDLYVTSLLTNSISRFHGVTGAYLGEFVASGSGALDYPVGLTFGPDGDLYVTSLGRGEGIRTVARFQGPSGSTPGAFLDTFVPAGSGGLQTPWGLLFGPDGNGDGHQDLYVNSAKYNKFLQAAGHTSVVLRYDGVTGAFLDTFVAAGSGHLDYPIFMTFTETDPVTLAYRGGDNITTAPLDDGPDIRISNVTKRQDERGLTTLFVLTVPLSAADDQMVTPSYRNADGTAKTSDITLVARTGTIIFSPGGTTKTITIEVKGDSKREANETFYLDLFDLSSNALFNRDRGLGTILNDD